MGKRKELKQEKKLHEQRERELQIKMNIRRTLGKMKKQSSKLDDFKQDYINKAREASLKGNNQTYKLAKSGLKLCLSKQKFLDTMIGQFEISMQITDMNDIVNDFLKGINIISDQMKTVTSTIDITKAQMAYEKALTNNVGQYEALDSFLQAAVESIDNLDTFEGNVTDDEIDNLITNQVLDEESHLDLEIDEKIKVIREKISY